RKEEVRPALAAVVPAAGFSRRMGREKTLLPLGGKPLLARVLSTLSAAGVPERIVVLRPGLDEAAAIAQRLGARIVVNPHAEEEMLLSIRLGLAELSPRAEAVYIWPADHPSVPAETIKRLAAAIARDKVALPVHAGRRGHPALVGRGLFAAIGLIPPNEGLRHLWRSRPEVLVEVAVEDPGVLLD